GTSGRPPDERFDNADSYACFVFYLARLANESSEDEEGADDGLAERAEAFRGGNLRIRSAYPESLLDVELSNDIYIDEPERTEYFKVVGAPDASGFSYRWALEAAGEVLPLTADEYRGSPAAFVPEDTKQRLRVLHAGGETRAEVVLRATLY